MVGEVHAGGAGEGAGLGGRGALRGAGEGAVGGGEGGFEEVGEFVEEVGLGCTAGVIGVGGVVVEHEDGAGAAEDEGGEGGPVGEGHGGGGGAVEVGEEAGGGDRGGVVARGDEVVVAH